MRPLFKPVPTPEIHQTSDKLLITIAVGLEHQSYLGATVGLMEQYADRCRADFIVLSNQTQDWGLLEKFRVVSYASAYKQTLFVDADVVIKTDCPDIFDAGRLVINNDMWFQSEASRNDWEIAWRSVMESQGLDIPFTGRIGNSGVVLCDQEHADIWTPPQHALPGNHIDEQIWLDANVRRLGYDAYLQELPRIYNHHTWMPDFFDAQRLQAAQMIHVTNNQAHQRFQLLQRFASDTDFPNPVQPEPNPWGDEPVGSKLAEVLKECGINPPNDCGCTAWVKSMDQWGIEGCRVNRQLILQRLADSSKHAGWIDWLRVAAKGYLSTESLLDEAIKRASA